MQADIPPKLRPMLFAQNELVLDLLYLLQPRFGEDLETILILLCVNDATMRPFMTDTALAQAALTVERPPESMRGSISRRMIADKTGLSRETVRRKTRKLEKAGLVVIDEDGRVRSAQLLGDPEFRRIIERAHEAVLRYRKTLRAFSVDPGD